MFKRTIAWSFIAMTLGTTVLAQNQSPPPPPDGGGGPGTDRADRGGPGDPSEMRQRMNDRMKQELGVNDQEWAALEPKIEAVRQLRRETSGPMFGLGGPGGPGGFGGPNGGSARGQGPGGPPQGSDRQRGNQQAGDGNGRPAGPPRADRPRPGDDGGGNDQQRGDGPPPPQGNRGQGPAGGQGFAGAFNRGGDRGQARGGDPNRQPSAVEQSMRDLRDATQGDASDAQVKQKLEALRKARADAKTKLVKAQENLKELVTPRQAAVLVQFGLLD